MFLAEIDGWCDDSEKVVTVTPRTGLRKVLFNLMHGRTYSYRGSGLLKSKAVHHITSILDYEDSQVKRAQYSLGCNPGFQYYCGDTVVSDSEWVVGVGVLCSRFLSIPRVVGVVYDKLAVEAYKHIESIYVQKCSMCEEADTYDTCFETASDKNYVQGRGKLRVIFQNELKLLGAHSSVVAYSDMLSREMWQLMTISEFLLFLSDLCKVPVTRYETVSIIETPVGYASVPTVDADVTTIKLKHDTEADRFWSKLLVLGKKPVPGERLI